MATVFDMGASTFCSYVARDRPFGGALAKLSTNARTIERQDGTSVDLTLALDRKRRIETRLQKAFIALATSASGRFDSAAARHSALSLQRAEADLHLEPEKAVARQLTFALPSVPADGHR